MNEAAEAANNLPAILLFWLWWTLLSVLEVVARTQGPVDARAAQGQESAAQDERFAEILRLDPGFVADAFLDGARRAYEIIVHAYAMADVERLRPLLSPDVLAAFADACARRAERGETFELTFVGFEGVDVADVAVSAGAMEVTLIFHTQVICALRSADGAVIDGDPSAVTEIAERWTFARALPVSGGAWTVVATDA